MCQNGSVLGLPTTDMRGRPITLWFSPSMQFHCKSTATKGRVDLSFPTLKSAKKSAKTQLKPGMDRTTVVKGHDGTYDVITDEKELESCIEDPIGDWTWGGIKKVWSGPDDNDEEEGES